MNANEWINLAGPLLAKFVVDLLRNFLPKLRAWQVQLLAIVIGSAGAWAAKFAGGADLPVWQVVALGCLAIVVNEAGNTIKGFREDKGPNGGNAGVIKLIVAGLLGAGLLLSPHHDAAAQQPATDGATVSEVVTQTGGNWLVDGVRGVASYISNHGEQRAGVGGTMEALSDGEVDAVLIQQISLPPFETHLKAWTLEHHLGLVHTTCFSGERNHEGVGLGISWKLLKIKPVEGVSLPTVNDLSELRLGASISPDVDKLVDGDFGRRWTVVAVTFGWAF